jgi:hypothetical protein
MEAVHLMKHTCHHVDPMLRGACNLLMGCELRLPFHLPIQSGNATYTCDDGALKNPIPTVCLPTCAAVNCSEYPANGGISMQYKNDVNLTETCDNLGGDDCKATCCAPSMELT